MEDHVDPPRERTQFKIIHIMIATALFAVIFAILQSNRRQWATLGAGLAFIYILFIVCLLVYCRIKTDVLQEVLENPSDDDDLMIGRLESALATTAVYSGGTALRGRFQLMQLYKVRKQYEKAIAEGQRILKRSRLDPCV